MDLVRLLAIGGLAMSGVMALLWLVQRRTGDAGIVDVAWGLGVAGLAAFFAYESPTGLEARRWLAAALVSLWALRLSGYILVRVLTLPEDGRYASLKEQWGAQAQPRLFRFYQYQAVGSLLFALPVLAACRNPVPWQVWDAVGITIWSISVVGESLADWQLSRFRRDPAHRGQVCQSGLWRYSRHPNYFFEWLHWWTYAALAVGSPLLWIALLAPVLMLYLILKVTGIPPTEAQSLRSRGEAYREYQRTTSAFFPWFPSRS